jgi:hypothetical protein
LGLAISGKIYVPLYSGTELSTPIFWLRQKDFRFYPLRGGTAVRNAAPENAGPERGALRPGETSGGSGITNACAFLFWSFAVQNSALEPMQAFLWSEGEQRRKRLFMEHIDLFFGGKSAPPSYRVDRQGKAGSLQRDETEE